jgi:hypothetical protein
MVKKVEQINKKILADGVLDNITNTGINFKDGDTLEFSDIITEFEGKEIKISIAISDKVEEEL